MQMILFPRRIVLGLLAATAIATLSGCGGDSAIQLATLDPEHGIVMMRRHDSPERLVWLPSARLTLDGDMHLIDPAGHRVPGVIIPRDFSAIRIDAAGRVYASNGHGSPRECGRVAVVSRGAFETAIRQYPNYSEAMEYIWRTAPDNVRLLHVGTPEK